MSDNPAPTAPPVRRSHGWIAWLIVVAMALVAGAWGWTQWQARSARESEQQADAGQRLDALEGRIDAIRRDQRSQLQRLQQADATNRVLRDEVLGIGQRSSLIEDTVSKLADPDRHGEQALRLDEAELLLNMAQQRLLIAGDLDGARRAYVLAGNVLDGIDDPAYLSLRQTLQQERAGVDALGTEPRVRAMAELDAFAQTISTAPVEAHSNVPVDAPWWRRAFATLIDVQPSDRTVAVQPADRIAAASGLQLEISLARAAAERRDEAGFRTALQRAEGWMTRLWPPSPMLDRQRAQLRQIAARELSLSLPTLGSTLQQLRQLRAAG
ncbi:uroporphyrinogen-III C-methyltransferase [Lysobacter auxotrophicus]|uniref:Uroporphyrinogen-III C-methyltransferase n=1 Tax=Lysobacter auxotrophicus TaxID=2992573 RepID=A0ABM8DIP7_9GAMM|nr:uroporphyrinogen-III C-methyltransferase [Lysobacter auxotrophicus]BDU18470.1 uroporphyrinogen-III C-methyltransferase [Lysobacter auxotrophicus]